MLWTLAICAGTLTASVDAVGRLAPPDGGDATSAGVVDASGALGRKVLRPRASFIEQRSLALDRILALAPDHVARVDARPAVTALLLAGAFWAIPAALASGFFGLVGAWKQRPEVAGKKLIAELATVCAFLAQLTLVSLFPLAGGKGAPACAFAVAALGTSVHAQQPWGTGAKNLLTGSLAGAGFAALFLVVIALGAPTRGPALALEGAGQVCLGILVLGAHVMLSRQAAFDSDPSRSKRVIEAQVAAGMWGAGAASMRGHVEDGVWFSGIALVCLGLGVLASRLPALAPSKRDERGSRPGLACGALLVRLFWALAYAMLGPRLPAAAFFVAGGVASVLPAPSATTPAALLGFLALAVHAFAARLQLEQLADGAVTLALGFLVAVSAWAEGVAVTSVKSDLGGAVVLSFLALLEGIRAIASSLELSLPPQLSTGASVLLSFAVLSAAVLVRERESGG